MAARSSVLTLHSTAGPRGLGWYAGRRGAGGAKTLGRPMGAVALRVPERLGVAQIVSTRHPLLFVHEGARQALERRLSAAFPGPVSLSITDNRHSMISHSWRRGMLLARIHHMFLDAPPSIVHALVRYVAHNDREASVRIGNYIEANGDRLTRRARNLTIVSSGKHHDLYRIFQELNERYFDGAVNALVTWGKRARAKKGTPRAKRQTIKLGSYSANERLIRVHPVLDRPWVPRYFVAYVLFHEMLHHVIPARRGDETTGRRELHPLEFRERERDFRHHDRAVKWESQHIGRLLRS